MGTIFPLSEKPSCFEGTLRLIEKSFGYQAPHSFQVDFAPLVDRSNHKNCFIMLDENENVLAHIGTKDRILPIGNEKFIITMLGGIAVDERFRGKGYFKTLMLDVLAEKKSETTLFLLWSDKEKLYKEFGFYLCGNQFEVESEKRPIDFTKTKYHLLSESKKKEIQDLYQKSFAKFYLTLERNQADWQMIEQTTSADLYTQSTGTKITDYFFMNKGQDLPGIIYEYGSTGELNELIETISHFGKTWVGKPVIKTENAQYQFLMTSGDLRLFTQFVLQLTQGKISIRNLNLMKQEVYFDFNEELLGLNLDEFLRGLFGPGTFEELDLPALYLSGLESI